MVKTRQNKIKKYSIKAEELAKEQKQVSVSEFFLKNRHLLGFDNPLKALTTTVKELVDNSLDACEELRVPPEIIVQIRDTGENHFTISVEDNGPGIVKKQIPNVFARLLYGSKFHAMKQSLTFDEQILIKEEGIVKVILIGEFIDRHMEGEGEVACKNIEVPCFDWKTYRYSFRKARSLIKHKRRNKIYKIKTKYGKEVKVTGCHSLFTVDKGTLEVKEIEARQVKVNDIIIAPKRLSINEARDEVDILQYISEEYARKKYWYYYTEKKNIAELFSQAKIVHFAKKRDKGRKYYQFGEGKERINIVDDSCKKYMQKGFLPVWIAKHLKVEFEGIVRTYYHGRKYEFPSIMPCTPSFMQFLGLFVAEGHVDRRQIGFTFSKNERDLIKQVCNTAVELGVNFTVEERPEKNLTRVKVFGGLLSHLFERWCGKGAKNKHIPSFVFTASSSLRQHFLDYLYRGDGHNTQGKNQLMLGTTSKQLANEVVHLWMLQGVVSSFARKKRKRGLGKDPVESFIVTVYGKDIRASYYFTPQITEKRRRTDLDVNLLSGLLDCTISRQIIPYLDTLSGKKETFSRDDLSKIFYTKKVGYKIHHLTSKGYLKRTGSELYLLTGKTKLLIKRLKKLVRLHRSDFLFLPVVATEEIDEGHPYVYDLSVPGAENFVGGIGGIACHNSRGQQGIGVSASVLYGQLTTGKATKITSKIDPKHPAHYFELHINTAKNEPEVLVDKEIQWLNKNHGTKVEIELEGKYQKGRLSVDEYIKQSAISNPHAQFTFINPLNERTIYRHTTKELPKEPKRIKPHPYGIELGMLMRMIKDTAAKTMLQFFTKEFSRVSDKVAREICTKANIPLNTKPKDITHSQADAIFKAIKQTKIMAPPTDCLSPIGEHILLQSLKKEVDAEFFTGVTRPTAVYRGIPFQIEAAIAYGGPLSTEDLVRLFRFANKVPLQYQQSACAITTATINTLWKNYGMQQSKGALPTGPAILVVHIASVWVPFTSESKESIAHYPEIIKEMKLALQECGRQLGKYLSKKRRIADEEKKKSYIEKYIPHIGESLKELLNLKDTDEKKIVSILTEELEKSRKM